VISRQFVGGLVDAELPPNAMSDRQCEFRHNPRKVRRSWSHRHRSGLSRRSDD
jgi:hypothetical protein